MKPIFKIGEHDYTVFLEKLSSVNNDLDAEGSGRNILDGVMYRSRITDKDGWTANFLPLPETIMLSLMQDVRPECVDITLLDPDTNTHVTMKFYISTRNRGDQQYNPGKGYTEYIGCSFKMTEV